MQIGKTGHPKIYVILWKTKIEDSRGLRRRYRGRNSVPKFQDILNTKTGEEYWHFNIEFTLKRSGALRRFKKRLPHGKSS